MKELLELLENEGNLNHEQLASMLDTTPEIVRKEIAEYESEGIILGYKTLIDWDKAGKEYVSAFIELKVSPQIDEGFDAIAARIYEYPEVKSVYLMSSAKYDLLLNIEGRTFRDVAYFVSYKLAPLENIVSTATHFVLKKYKDKGTVFGNESRDERENII
ncbi:MAG: Lrp/AsnC family transcriptional regulator [Ruminococcaceae bacterium]|nr:Lrp/AsnC family transcriptional regulator [Oscillospiraceae bacterium]